MLDINNFRAYIKQTRGLKDSTIEHYVTGLNSINVILKQENYIVCDVQLIDSIEKLENLKDFLFNNLVFIEKDTIGHHMYSVAFKHFYRYAYKTISSQIVG